MDPGTATNPPMRPVNLPIPAPRRLPGGIYVTMRKGRTTLQEQMRLRDDRETLVRITRLIRRTARQHVDLTLRYIWQDPALLEKIKQEVLEKCPMLAKDYVDAWPIETYLKLALKEHIPPAARRAQLQRMRSKYEHSVQRIIETDGLFSKHKFTKLVAVAKSTRGTAGVAGRRVSFAISSSKPSARHTSTHTTEIGSEEPEVNAHGLADERSTRRDAWHGTRLGVAPSLDMSLSDGSPLGSAYAEQRVPLANPLPVFIHYVPDRDRNRAPPSRQSHPRTRSAHADSDSDAVGIAQPSVVASPASSLDNVRDMLLACAMPPADASRIAHLLSSLGVTDIARLRAPGRMSFYAAWLSEMREKGEMTEIQARVVRDLLDAAGASG